MKLVIEKDRKVYSAGTWGTKNENNYEILEFEFPAELESYNKRIVYYLDNQRVWDAIVDNKAIITNQITTKGTVKAYVWCTKTDAQYETDVDFRTQLFEMNFFENENADGIVPTPEQVDGFNTILTAMNNKIAEVNALETTIETAETERQQAEISREERTDAAIDNIIDMTATYNQNAQEKTDAFNTNASQKTTDFNTNASQKTNDFNTNAENKTANFNDNAIEKTQGFDLHVVDKTEDFDDFADERQDEIQAICDTARDFVSAVTFTTIEENFETGNLEVNNEESLGNMGFQFNYDTGNLEVEING